MKFSSNYFLSRIAGEVAIDDNPGIVLKAWRVRLEIKQNYLASEMKISPSVLSDYESGRRLSPGASFIRRYVEALARIDKGSKQLLNRFVKSEDESAILSIGEFKQPVEINDVITMLDGEILSGHKYLNLHIHGYTLLDSIKTIYSLSGLDFYRIFGATSERVLIFTNVGMGRSPLVAIRVSQLKPRMVVLHGPESVDSLALDLAEMENIVLILSNMKRLTGFTEVFEKYLAEKDT